MRKVLRQKEKEKNNIIEIEILKVPKMGGNQWQKYLSIKSYNMNAEMKRFHVKR